MGHLPEMVCGISGSIPRLEEVDDPGVREGYRRALDYMALEPGQPLEGIELDKVFIGSCTNARIEDLRAVAAVVEGRRVHERIRQALIVPGSGQVRLQAESEGLDRIFLDAGFEWRAAGCSMCLGMNDDRLSEGSVVPQPPTATSRGAPGQGRPYPPDEPGNGGGGRGDRCHYRCEGVVAMQPFSTHTGIVIPFDRRNVDTDAIVPKQYLKMLEKTGFGAFLFDDERYLDPGDVETPLTERRTNPDFILNQPPYDQGSILLARDNFGCGSSREHAVWALADFGIPRGDCAQLRRDLLQ